MNGKHPIDELFARSLRDAEAAPPPAVWEGIMRERNWAHVALLRLRRNWGYAAAALLLLLSGITYWALPTDGASHEAQVAHTSASQSLPQANAQLEGAASTTSSAKTVTDHGAAIDPAPGSTSSAGKDAQVENTPSSSKAHTGDGANAGDQPGAARTAGSGRDRASTGKTPKEQADQNNYPPTDRSTNGSSSSASGADREATLGAAALTASSSNADHESGEQNLTPSRVRSAYDGTARLDALMPLVTTTPAGPPGTLMHGDSTPVYVLAKHNLWFGVQAEWMDLNGSWQGTGAEVAALNESEHWQDAGSVGIVGGVEWRSGLSLGLGIGVSQQRSHFFRREEEPGNTTLTLDTTWVGAPQGQVTNYTWDIVETLITEPGTSQEYNATNIYTRLRIAPEIGYQLAQRRRWSLHARVMPSMLITLERKGNTLVAAADSLEGSNGTAMVRLQDAAVDGRFPVCFAASANIELRYFLTEKISLGVMPTYEHMFPNSTGGAPRLVTNGFGGALRLCVHLSNNELSTR